MIKKLSLLFIGLVTFSQVALATEVIFSDLQSTNPNYVAIKYLGSQGVIKGYQDGTYKPNNLINRAEALKILLDGKKVVLQTNLITTSFSDVKITDWFAKYVETAKKLSIITGTPDGLFMPGRNVTRAEYLKMLLNINGFRPESWKDLNIYTDVKPTDWYAPYLNYAGQSGLIQADQSNQLYPAKELTRGEVAEIFYLMTIIKNGKDTQFLLNQAEIQMAQIEIYMGAGAPDLAKRASELAVDMTQQAYKNTPDNNIVIGAAKLARAYSYLVNAYISAIGGKYDDAANWANQATSKATEAWQVNNELQPICKHIKDRAKEIIDQIQKETGITQQSAIVVQ